MAAIFGATASSILFLGLRSLIILQLLMHFLVNPCMILIGFRIRQCSAFFKYYLVTYVLTLLIGGVMSWGMIWLQKWGYYWIFVLLAFVVCLLVIRWKRQQLQTDVEYDVLLITKEKKISVRGFYDSGNLLQDPISRQPVHILQEQVLENVVFPRRYIPFRSLGQEQGMLGVIALEGMYLCPVNDPKKQKAVYLDRPLCGLASEKLFSDSTYQILINGKTMK